MTKLIKLFYLVVSFIYVVLTIYEVFVFMTMDSNYVGIAYLFMNFFSMFLILTVTYNYSKASVKLRISKNIIALTVGLISSFIIILVLPDILGYMDSSRVFIKNTFISSQIIKPMIYMLLGLVSYIEFKNVK